MSTNTPKMAQENLAAPQQDAVSEKDSSQAAEISELRLTKIRQYQSDALQQPDALQANLGAISSDLMLLAYRLHETINRSLAGSSTGKSSSTPANTAGRIAGRPPAPTAAAPGPHPAPASR